MPDERIEAPPTWVAVWFWMRFARRDFRVLPQEGGPNRMSWEEYDRCVQAWMRAGSPKPRVADIVRAMTAGDVAESFDEEVPF